MAKVTLSENDPFIITVKDSQETIDIFGEDYLEDYGVELTPELMERYKTNYQEFQNIQRELRLIFERKGS